jgi:hypothetical protein
MEDYKRIAKSIRMHHLMVSLVCSAGLGLVLFAVMIAVGSQSQWLIGLEVTGGIFVLSALIALITAAGAGRRIHKRIVANDGSISLENESFTSCAKELSYGKEWLVYHHENTYLFWTKKNIHQIKVISQKKNHLQLAVYSTLHPEGESIRCTAGAETADALQKWLSSADNA